MPKKERLAYAESTLEETMNLLAAKRSQLAELEAKLAQLKSDYADGCQRRERLANEVDMCAKRLARASALIGGLGTEQERWSEAEIKLRLKLDNLTGDILLSAATIAYLGPLTSSFRDKCIMDWVRFTSGLGIACSSRFSLSETLGSAVVIEAWTEAGLPRDSFSVDNAVMMYNQKKWPLLIDPQGQANQWLKSSEAPRGLILLRPTQSDWLRVMETSLPSGRPILMEEVGEQLDSSLEPILNKVVHKHGGVEMIAIGDGLVEYNSQFQFYMTTKLRNPHYLPEVTTKVAVINAGITREGLEDQLLGIVVAQERPDLEEMRQKLVKDGAACRAALQQVEDQILATLANSDGNLLEDEGAIRVLDESKALSQEISTKQQLALETGVRMEASRRAYFPVAQHAAVLFFCLAELVNINPMYQYSLEWFIRLFRRAITDSEKSDDVARRMEILQKYFTYALYTNVCRSLFEKDKLAFSMALTSTLLIGKGSIDPVQMDLFLNLTGGRSRSSASECPTWLSLKAWEQVCQLSSQEPFKGIHQSLIEQGQLWQVVANHANPFELNLPVGWDAKLAPFPKLLLLRYLTPNKVVQMVGSFVAHQLDPSFVRPPPFDLSRSFADSNCVSPLIFLLSAGADPMACLLRFAEERSLDNRRLHIVSLGQGQGVLAEEKIRQAVISGDWVILQNCHLCTSWMPTLERICQTFKAENIHPDFRLWLTSYPSTVFPVSILQSGVKITNEPPAGLKENLLRSFQPDPLENLMGPDSTLEPQKRLAVRKLTYSLCFFHALVQERRTYGAIGWNIPYAFDDSDLQISLRQTQIFVCDYPEVPYQALNYLIGECHYGGRVTDDWDRRTLSTLLADFCNSRLVQDPEYSLVSGEQDIYRVPHSVNYHDYLDAIRQLPTIQAPTVFGMHDNVIIARDLLEGDNLMSSLIALQNCYSSGVDLSGMDSADDNQPTKKSLDTKLAEIILDFIEQVNWSNLPHLIP